MKDYKYRKTVYSKKISGLVDVRVLRICPHTECAHTHVYTPCINI